MGGTEIQSPLTGRLPSEAVVEAVAKREGIEIIGLETPLYWVIDPEALDTLVTQGRDSGGRSAVHVEFRYYGYDVTVRRDGSVSLS